MEKRKYKIWYWILTVIAILVFLVYAKVSHDLRSQGIIHYNFTPYITVSKIIMSILWAALLVTRSRCYLRTVSKKSDLIPEIVFAVLGVAYIVWIAMGAPAPSAEILYVALDESWLSIFFGIALADVILSIFQLKKQKKADETSGME